MSCKRTRSSKTFAENLIVIQDEEARERFVSIFKNQHMMLEKKQFYDAPSMPDEDLLREFYANLTMSDTNEVLVRKKKVPLTSKSINDLFNLPDVEEDEYSTMMTNINWNFLQQVLNVVTNPGSK
ncbi:hypothetical protein J1N35_005132 [Gossypium stocksii]|uniref:Uncharacterized protein n=1 Tax=Gossypium stocksii TaxID=47602 RepID=A0A9D3WE18_9ROSI|nr:hypothetical protein J1N35_005132 [Gossypium stocksii]